MALTLKCSEKKVSYDQICKDFYELNKNRDFDGLFDVSIANRRTNSVFDKASNKYDVKFNTIDVYDTASHKYFIIPVFQRGAMQKEQASAFEKLSSESKILLALKLGTSPDSLFESYVRYINHIYEKYYAIETPKAYTGKNVGLHGIPSQGKLIEFALRENVKVYYVDDTIKLKGNWPEFAKRRTRLGDHWYYEIMSTSSSR